MATLTVRDLDETLKAKLRVRAAENGRSMEAEVRAILHTTLTTVEPAGGGLGTQIRELFAAAGGVDLDLPSRRDVPRAAELPE